VSQVWSTETSDLVSAELAGMVVIGREIGSLAASLRPTTLERHLFRPNWLARPPECTLPPAAGARGSGEVSGDRGARGAYVFREEFQSIQAKCPFCLVGFPSTA
jgi:hypothetical protein